MTPVATRADPDAGVERVVDRQVDEHAHAPPWHRAGRIVLSRPSPCRLSKPGWDCFIDLTDPVPARPSCRSQRAASPDPEFRCFRKRGNICGGGADCNAGRSSPGLPHTHSLPLTTISFAPAASMLLRPDSSLGSKRCCTNPPVECGRVGGSAPVLVTVWNPLSVVPPAGAGVGSRLLLASLVQQHTVVSIWTRRVRSVSGACAECRCKRPAINANDRRALSRRGENPVAAGLSTELKEFENPTDLTSGCGLEANDSCGHIGA